MGKMNLFVFVLFINILKTINTYTVETFKEAYLKKKSFWILLWKVLNTNFSFNLDNLYTWNQRVKYTLYILAATSGSAFLTVTAQQLLRDCDSAYLTNGH